jgi:hypothetical protein
MGNFHYIIEFFDKRTNGGMTSGYFFHFEKYANHFFVNEQGLKKKSN